MPDFTNLLDPEPIEESTEITETEEVSDEPIDEDASISADGEGDEPASAEAEVATEADEGEPKPLGDGRTIPAELKELIKAHPDRAKLLKDLYFTNSRYNKFGKVADLQKLKATVDRFGSLEEATKLQDRLDEIGSLDELVNSHKEYERLDEQFTAADPAYVDHLAKANPEAFSKLAPSFLSRFGNDHPEQYNYLMSQVVMSTLINNGTLNGLSLLKQAAASGNVEQVKQVVDQIEGGLNALQALSQKAPQVRTTDPRAQQLEQERAQFQRERQEAFVNDVKGKTAEWVSPEITKALTVYGKAVTPGLAKRLDQAVKEEIGSILGQNNQFQTKVKQAIQRGDRDGALRLYRQFVQPLVNQASRKVASEFGLKAISKKGVAANGQQSGKPQAAAKVEPGFEKVTRFPDVKDVKRDFPEYYDWAAKDQFLLKNGKKIKVVS